MTNIKRFKHVSSTNGAITYLEINHDNQTYTNDYYKANAGNLSTNTQMTTIKEIKRLTKHTIEIMEYKEA